VSGSQSHKMYRIWYYVARMSASPSPVQVAPRLLQPGVRVVLWIRRAGLEGIWHVVQVLIPGLLTLVCLWVDVSGNRWSIGLAIALVVLAVMIGYGFACERFVDTATFRSRLRVLNEGVVGHLSVLLRGYCEYDETKIEERAAFQERILAL
jgi:hypothetical protein